MKEYFPHDYYARNDIKLVKLQMKLGYEAKGIYWDLIEMMYEQGGNLHLSECESYAFAMRTECEKIANVLRFDELFVISGDTVTNESVTRRLMERNEKSNKAAKSASKRWEKDANAMRTQCDGNAIKEKKRKEKEIKVKNSKVKNSKEEETIVFNELKTVWLDFYKNKTDLPAYFSGKDAGSISQITRKIQTSILASGKELTDKTIVDSFRYILNHLPPWYLQHGLSIAIINSKYDELIAGIKQRSATSDDQIERELITSLAERYRDEHS